MIIINLQENSAEIYPHPYQLSYKQPETIYFVFYFFQICNNDKNKTSEKKKFKSLMNNEKKTEIEIEIKNFFFQINKQKNSEISN